MFMFHIYFHLTISVLEDSLAIVVLLVLLIWEIVLQAWLLPFWKMLEVLFLCSPLLCVNIFSFTKEKKGFFLAQWLV